MVAIFQGNQHAFDGNINVLRAGATLRIPDEAAIQAIPASAAAAEVSRQYKLWREGSSAAQSSAESAGRLRLVTPEQGTAAASTATASTTTGTTEGASATQMQSRVQQLEAELAEARRLLEVKNAELATLQGQGATGQPAAGGAATGAAAPAATVPGAPAPSAAAPGVEAPVSGTPPTEAAAPVEQAQPAPAPKPKPQAKAPKPVQPEKGPSLTETLAGYWWVALGLLAAALAFVMYRRSRGDSGAKEVDLQEALGRTRTDLRARPAPRDAAIVVEERRPVEPARAAPASRAPTPAPATSRKPAAVEDTISGEEPVSVDSGDPLAEADFHMAYGLYDQAADLVQLAIKRAPQRRDLKLKLLEIFFVWGNRDRFLELAGEMNASRDDAQPGEWDKVMIMGKQIAPEDAMFAGSRPMASSLDMELHGSAGPLDMDLGADHGATRGIDFPPDGAKRDGGLDFEMSEHASGGDALAPTIETARIPVPAGSADEPTQEVAIEDLGLDLGDSGSLDDAADEDMLAAQPRAVVEDTVESPRLSSQKASREDDEDLLSATGILKEQTGIMPGLDNTGEIPTIDAGEATGILPTIKTTKLDVEASGGVDFDLGDEPFTMSEVGTKLDLARAYVDMGDPEGARSILDEVLKEGSAQQKQEAERLMASLP
jgi:pilus assembly protein FimV